MNNENRNEEAVSPVIATILMVAITVVLAGVLYVWASSLADDSKSSGVPKYNFDARDAPSSLSTAGGEDLVYISMTQMDEPLPWSTLKLTMTAEQVDDDGNSAQGPSLNCAKAGSNDAANAPCVWSTTSTKSDWEVSDEITITEGTESICDGVSPEGGCDLVITLTKEAVGEEDGGLLKEVKTYAAA